MPSMLGPTQEVDTKELFSEVLLVEDDPAHARLIERAVSPLLGTISHVTSIRDAIQHLQQNFIELILCDFHLSDSDALDLLRVLREAGVSTPLIILTSSESLDDAVSAMSAGAWDYLVKHFSSDLAQRFKLSLQRVAQRKLEQTRRAQLRVERDAFAAATVAALDGVAILSRAGSLVFQNQAFRDFLALMGWEEDKLEGVSVVDCLARHDFHVAQALQVQLSEAGLESLWSSEIAVAVNEPGAEAGSDGLQERQKPKVTKYHFEITLSNGARPSRRSSDTTVYNRDQFVLWVRDITRRKDEERFQRDLLATTSHDLKGPLGAILSSCEMITDLQHLPREKIDQLATQIASCARGSITLIDELLSARRIQDGMFIIRPSKQLLLELAEEIVYDFQPIARSREITLKVGTLSPTASVYADRIGIRRVLGNLVSNALKFTPKGGMIEVTGEEFAQESRLAVSDTGAGIDPQDRHVLFERYGRLEKHRGVEGTGLGLYVCRNIAMAHGGRIEVKSEAGVGSVFTVVLPAPPIEPGK